VTPSEAIVLSAAATGEVVDADGRRLQFRRLTALDKLRLFKAVGPVLAQNEPYLGMAVLAFSVSAIDGVPQPPPINEAHIEGLVSRLGDVGLAAIATGLSAGSGSESKLGRELAGN
jgi:hypothetical protein